jgi:3-deoxy-D-manno-octulosonic-acid transferase
MRIVYNVFIHLYNIALHIASLFNAKAKLWVGGRKGIFTTIKSQIVNPKSEILWFHCASLGEFEQARPLIEAIRQSTNSSSNPVTIVLTFFSPSGYEIRKNYTAADHVFYLPIDTPANAKRFVKLINPTKVFFIKYEFWFNYLNVLKKHNIPTYLVSGIFRDNHYFFKPYGGWARRQLRCFTHFFLQDENSYKLLQKIGIKNATVCGDTRFDRVADTARNVKSFPLIEQFTKGQNVLIGGSTWHDDEKIIAQWKLHISNYKVIIAPHTIDEEHIQSIISLFKSNSIIRYSMCTERTMAEAQIMIIDNIGTLSSLYQYGTIAFIGGGFGSGIHNILEAATFGLPVIFGPEYHKFNEAHHLIRLGGAFAIEDEHQFENTMKQFSDPKVLENASKIARTFVENNTGATGKILKFVFG